MLLWTLWVWLLGYSFNKWGNRGWRLLRDIVSSSPLKQLPITALAALLRLLAKLWSDPELGVTLAGNTPSLDCLPGGDLLHLALNAVVSLKDGDGLCALSSLAADGTLFGKTMRDDSQPWESEAIVPLPRWSDNELLLLLFIVSAQFSSQCVCFLSISFLNLIPHLFFSSTCYQPHLNDSRLLGQSGGLLLSSESAVLRTAFTASAPSMPSSQHKDRYL